MDGRVTDYNPPIPHDPNSRLNHPNFVGQIHTIERGARLVKLSAVCVAVTAVVARCMDMDMDSAQAAMEQASMFVGLTPENIIPSTPAEVLPALSALAVSNT